MTVKYCYRGYVIYYCKSSSSLRSAASFGARNRPQYQCRAHSAGMASSGTPFVSGRKTATNAVMTPTQTA